jgi:hypothetical protein
MINEITEYSINCNENLVSFTKIRRTKPKKKTSTLSKARIIPKEDKKSFIC